MRLFLSYAREDFDAVSTLYDRLEEVGLRPWMDKRDLLPGQWWRGVIAREVKQSDLVLVCLSPQSVDNRGFFQREIRVALDAWQEKRQDDIYLIPVRLAACDVPQELADFNWVDLDDTNNWKLLLRSIEKAARSLGRPVPVELAAVLASGQKRLPQSPVEAPADEVVRPPDPKVTSSVVKVAQGESKGNAGSQVRQRTRGGSWWLLAGLVVVVAALAIIAYRAGLIPRGQVPAAEEAGGTATVGAIVALPTQTPTFAATPAPTSGPTDTPSSTQGPDVTPARSTATSAATSAPVSTATSEAVILFGDMMTVTSPIEMELVRVPAGEFLMGSDPAKDSLAIESEQPQYQVDLPEYYIGKYEVTNAQYETFVRTTGHVVPSHWANGHIPAEKRNHPVVNVPWKDALAFTDWLSASTGLACRLPTEAEWEKTCRGTEGLIYPWGDSAPDTGKANFNNNVGDTTSVGSYSPKGDSPYGVADMAGNVWEWTGSLYGPYPYNLAGGREDESVSGENVVRGGSFKHSDGSVRCAFRVKYFPDVRADDFGFRILCVSPAP